MKLKSILIHNELKDIKKMRKAPENKDAIDNKVDFVTVLMDEEVPKKLDDQKIDEARTYSDKGHLSRASEILKSMIPEY